MEALRLYPVVTCTSFLWFEHGAKLGPLYLQPKESFLVDIFGLHRNGDYWQRPKEFLPDRFDALHPLSKTPTGQKRNPYAFLPFNGGKRICFGKTFAECVLKVVVTMVSQTFDMKFVQEGKYTKDNLPVLAIAMSHIPELPVIVTERKA